VIEIDHVRAALKIADHGVAEFDARADPAELERILAAAAHESVRDGIAGLGGVAAEEGVAAVARAFEDREAEKLIDPDRGAAEVVVGEAIRDVECRRRRRSGVVERVDPAVAEEGVIARPAGEYVVVGAALEDRDAGVLIPAS